MSSLRTRLILGTLVGVTLSMGGTGAAMYAILKQRLVGEVDRSLVAIVKASAPAIARIPRGSAPPPPRERQPPWPDPRRNPPPSPFPELSQRADLLFQCWSPTGLSLEKSESLGESELPRIARELEPVGYDAIDRAGAAFDSIELPTDGSPARAIGLRFQPPSPPEGAGAAGRPGRPERLVPIELVIAVDAVELTETLRDLRWLLAIAWAVASLGCAGILALVIRRGLRPVDRLRGQIEDLHEGELDRRVEIPGAPAELTPVIDELNLLLARMRQALEREQAFSAHAAHELRTPLSGLRSTLEVSLSRPRSSAEYREAAELCLEITAQMQILVEDLLDLARLASRPPSAECERLALADVLRECWEPFADEAGRRDLRLAVEIDAALSATADWPLLRRVLGNLLENAVSYADEGTPIEVRAELDGSRLALCIANRAEGAPPDIAEKAFDTFWRADPSRTDTGRHAGLGLALCRRIAEILGGSIEASLREGHFVVRLRLEVDR